MVFFTVPGKILGGNWPWEKGEVQGTGRELWKRQGRGKRTESSKKAMLLGR